MRKKYSKRLFDYIKTNHIEYHIINIKLKGRKKKEYYSIDFGNLDEKHLQYIKKLCK